MISVGMDIRGIDRALADLGAAIEKAPDRLHNLLQGRQGRFANKALSQLQQTPPPPVYPIRWKSARQRRAFFASDGFGKGIPTRRSGELQRGWRVVYQRSQYGGVLRLINPISYKRFVQGDAVQPFHLDTGWVQESDVIDKFIKEAGDAVIEVWQTVGDEVVKTTR